MANQIRRLDVRSDIDWQSDSVWVQDAALLSIDRPPEPGGPPVTGLLQNGQRLTLSPEALETKFSRVGGEGGLVWKPRYQPVRAYAVATPAEIFDEGEPVALLEAGGAVLLYDDGRTALIDAKRYERDFKAVGFKGSAFPAWPFETC